MAILLIKPIEFLTLGKLKANVMGIDLMDDEVFQGHIDVGTPLTPPPTFAKWTIEGTHRDGVNHLDGSTAEFKDLVQTVRMLGVRGRAR